MSGEALDASSIDASSLGVGELAARLGRAAPPAGAGILAAAVVTLAAGLCESLARAALMEWSDAAGIAAQAVHLRDRADAAETANAGTYARARDRLQSLTTRSETAGTPRTGGDAMLRAALLDAADTLLTILSAATDCAALGAEIAHAVGPDLRPDAVGAAELATGAAAAADLLLRANLALPEQDGRRELAAELLAEARRESARAREVLS